MPFALQPPGARSYYPFRFFDDVTKKWTVARYVAELHVIAERYAQWEIIGPPEFRTGDGTMFSPWAKSAPRPAAHLPPVEEPLPDHGPTPRSGANSTAAAYRRSARAIPGAAIPAAVCHVVRAGATICCDERGSAPSPMSRKGRSLISALVKMTVGAAFPSQLHPRSQSNGHKANPRPRHRAVGEREQGYTCERL